MGEVRPRRVVLAQCWVEAGIDAPSLTRDGLPVARAVKCLIDPLVVRPRLRPALAAPLLGPAEAAELTQLLEQHRTRLEEASAWFPLLRAARRRAKITDGNAQELYFPRAFELASQFGPPGADADAVCDDVIAEVHGEVSVADLTLLVDALPASPFPDWVTVGVAPDVAALAAEVWELLDSGEYLTESSELDAWAFAMRRESGQLAALLDACPWDGPVEGVRLSAHDPLPAPPVRGEAACVLDRSLESRARGALRRSRDRAESAADILTAEIARAGQPLGLHDPFWRATFLAGVVLSAGLDPLQARRDFGPVLLRQVQSRLAKEAYVMHLRRLLAAGQAIDPRQGKVVDQLHAFWSPYLQRLWARLHGLDVVGRSPADTDEVWDLLTGVARSVMYDHRQSIRDALEAAA